MLPEAVAAIRASVNEKVIENIVSVVPDDWLSETSDGETPEGKRAVYAAFLKRKLENIELLSREAADAGKATI